MHATIEQLIAAADSAAQSDALQRHLRECADCRHAAAQIGAWRGQLRELPGLEPRAGLWAQIEGRHRARQRRVRWNGPLAGLVAAGLAGLTVAGWWFAAGPEQSPPQIGAAAPPPSDDAVTELSRLRAQAEALQRALHALPERQVMRLSTAGTIVQLEDRLAWVDGRLHDAGAAAPEQQARLLRARVDLMNSLWEVRYAEVAF